jgi:hypothetical protein
MSSTLPGGLMGTLANKIPLTLSVDAAPQAIRRLAHVPQGTHAYPDGPTGLRSSLASRSPRDQLRQTTDTTQRFWARNGMAAR